jgi:hypothetical protein
MQLHDQDQRQLPIRTTTRKRHGSNGSIYGIPASNFARTELMHRRCSNPLHPSHPLNRSTWLLTLPLILAVDPPSILIVSGNSADPNPSRLRP